MIETPARTRGSNKTRVLELLRDVHTCVTPLEVMPSAPLQAKTVKRHEEHAGLGFSHVFRGYARHPARIATRASRDIVESHEGQQ